MFCSFPNKIGIDNIKYNNYGQKRDISSYDFTSENDAAHLNNQLTPWIRVLLEKPGQSRNALSYGTQRFITMFTTACH
jgi:hypothetical protein